jgi:methylated-DNA-[protein]-cysteine S-methyltransferase
MATPFQEKVYSLTKKVPRGRVTTYANIVHAIGTRAYRSIGQALNRNLYADVPCHRVIASKGKVRGFAHGAGSKTKILESEGLLITDGQITDLSKVMNTTELLDCNTTFLNK